MRVKFNQHINRAVCFVSLFAILVAVLFHSGESYLASEEYNYVFNGSIITNHYNFYYGEWSNFTNTYGFNGDYQLELWDESFDHVTENYRFTMTFDSGEVIAKKGNSFNFDTNFYLSSEDFGPALHTNFVRAEITYCNPAGEWKLLGYGDLSGSGTVHFMYRHPVLREDVRMVAIHVYLTMFGAFEDSYGNYLPSSLILFRNPSYVNIYGESIPLRQESDALKDSINGIGSNPGSGSLPDIDDYVPGDALSLFTRLLSRITESSVVTGHLIIAVSVSFVSYALFGKKG